MEPERPTVEGLQDEVDQLRQQVRTLQLALAASRRPPEDEREVIVRLLGLLSSGSDLHLLLREVTVLLQHCSGCEAVGIRLRSGADFPYVETRGFPAAFGKGEHSLCTTAPDAQASGEGRTIPVRDCMCGLVLSGRTDPVLPCFTPHGTFWTNSTTELLAHTSEAECQAPIPNRCHGEGSESVALVPLRSGGTVYGLWQFQDRRPGRFSPEKIALLERLANNLALALAQRQSQEALRVSEQRYRTIVEQQSELVIHFHGLDRPTFVNQAFCRFFATAADTILRDGVERFVWPEDWPKTVAYFEDLLAGRAGSDFEHRMVRSDGAIRWIAWLTQVFHDSEGKVATVQGVGRDVTELKEAEQTLRESEARFRRVFDHRTLGMALVDPGNFQLLQANARLGEILGYSAEELVRTTVATLAHPDDWPAEQALLQAMQEGRQTCYSHQKRCVCRNGQVCWVQVTVTVLAEKAGIPQLLLSVVEDIHERRRAEAALQESERFVGSILACAGEGIVVYDRQLRYQVWNPFMERLLGLPAAEVLGRRALEVFPHLRANGIDRLLRRVLRGEVVQTSEFPFSIPQNGKTGWVVARYSPRLGEDGQITGVVALIHDATERKRAEEKLLRMQAQLAHSGRLATMGELLAGIAHEINQPLYSIVNYANACGNLLAQETPDLSLLRSWMAETRNAAERAGEIIRRLRDFARGSSQGHSWVQVQDLLAESIELVAFDTRTRGILVERCVTVEVPRVHVDRVQIQQVLVNLLRNASEAVEPVPVERRRVIVQALPVGDGVQISVSDNGPGVPPESELAIFDPFFTTKKDGLGLGLAISKTIVQAHGGELQVAVNPTGGATFRFLLPAEGGRRCAEN